MALVEVVYRSSVRPPHIQINLSAREARLIANDHKNLKECLCEDLEKALKFIEKREGLE